MKNSPFKSESFTTTNAVRKSSPKRWNRLATVADARAAFARSRKIYFYILHALGIFLCLCAFPAQAEKFHPQLHWQTTEAEHFLFHYDESLAPIVEKFAPKAKLIHQYVSAFFNWTPTDKTHVILTDHTDTSNAYATPTYANKVVLYLYPPAALNGLEDFNDWLELVFLHEYVHIIHLDKAEGFPRHLRSVFGRHFLLFPNTFLPRWFTEGIATYIETDDQLAVGRGQSHYFRSLMRLEVANGVASLGHISGLPSSWPGGHGWYLYGVYFFKFLRDTYGEEGIQKLIDAHSEFPLPFVPSVSSWMALDKTYSSLWTEFRAWLEQEFKDEIENIQADLNEGEQVTREGQLTGYALPISEEEILYLQDDKEKPASLRLWNTRKNTHREIALVRAGEFDFHSEKGILIPQREVIDNVNEFHDLYVIDPLDGAQTRLTHGARYPSASWSPDGSRIAAVNVSKGIHQLDLLLFTGEKLDTLWTEPDVFLGSIDWSPQTEQIVASVWRKNRGWNLEIFDPGERRWLPLTDDDNIEGHPRFTGDGNHILYTADYGGVYNIYMINLLTLERRKLTNVLGGAFHPALSVDNETLYYAGLTTDGYNLFRLQWQNHQSVSIPAAEQTPHVARFEQNDARAPKRETQPYQAMRYLLPKWWQPTFNFSNNVSEFGFNTAASDPLEWHRYALLYSHNFKRNLPSWQFNYVYDRYLPSIVVNSTRILSTYTHLGETAYVVSSDTLSALIALPVIKRDHEFSLYTGMVMNREQIAYRDPMFPSLPSMTDYTVGTGAFINTLRFTERAVTPSRGIFARGTSDMSQADVSDYSGRAATIDISLYSPLVFHTVMSANLIAGYGDTTIRPFTLGGSTGLNALNDPYSLGKRDYPLRGYSSVAASGREGNRMEFVNAEWHLPLSFIEWGTLTPPLGLHRLRLNTFAEAGRAWFTHKSARPPLLRALGGELVLEVDIGHRLRVMYKAGLAKGLDTGGELQRYFVIGGLF